MIAVVFVVSAITAAIVYRNLGNSSHVIGIPSGALSNPAPTNLTSMPGGQVVLADPSFPADDFKANGTTSTFTCGTAPSAAYVALTDNGGGSASVTSVSITSGGNGTTFTPSGACVIGAAAGAASYIVFPATSQITPTPLQGAYFAGIVSLSDDTQIPFEGTWQ